MQNELNKYFKGTLKSSSSLPNRTTANVMDMIQKIPLSVYTYRHGTEIKMSGYLLNWKNNF